MGGKKSGHPHTREARPEMGGKKSGRWNIAKRWRNPRSSKKSPSELRTEEDTSILHLVHALPCRDDADKNKPQITETKSEDNTEEGVWHDIPLSVQVDLDPVIELTGDSGADDAFEMECCGLIRREHAGEGTGADSAPESDTDSDRSTSDSSASDSEEDDEDGISIETFDRGLHLILPPCFHCCVDHTDYEPSIPDTITAKLDKEQTAAHLKEEDIKNKISVAKNREAPETVVTLTHSFNLTDNKESHSDNDPTKTGRKAKRAISKNRDSGKKLPIETRDINVNKTPSTGTQGLQRKKSSGNGNGDKMSKEKNVEKKGKGNQIKTTRPKPNVDVTTTRKEGSRQAPSVADKNATVHTTDTEKSGERLSIPAVDLFRKFSFWSTSSSFLCKTKSEDGDNPTKYKTGTGGKIDAENKIYATRHLPSWDLASTGLSSLTAKAPTWKFSNSALLGVPLAEFMDGCSCVSTSPLFKRNGSHDDSTWSDSSSNLSLTDSEDSVLNRYEDLNAKWSDDLMMLREKSLEARNAKHFV